VILGIGASFGATGYGVPMPKGKQIIHATLDGNDLNVNVPVTLGLVGDAGLTLDALIAELRDILPAGGRDRSGVEREIASVRESWLSEWLPKLTSDETPMTPYRVIWDLLDTVDVANTIITHDAGSPRDQLSPFWRATSPLGYLGWGKSTQLGYGLGLAMGAKLACPEKLCINVMGDAAIGFTGMDFETAVRERIPSLTILLNNFSMAIELDVMPVSGAKYGSTDISGDYAAMARAFGGYGERVSDPSEIKAAVRRAVAATEEGQPALLEFLTSREQAFSLYPVGSTD
jgi:acetolactate synthase-1/2/3 large subunit